jgi:hypothetical protein
MGATPNAARTRATERGVGRMESYLHADRAQGEVENFPKFFWKVISTGQGVRVPAWCSGQGR